MVRQAARLSLLAVSLCACTVYAAWDPPRHPESCRGGRFIQSLPDCAEGDNLLQGTQDDPETDWLQLVDHYVYTYDDHSRPTCMVVDGKRVGIFTCPGSIRWYFKLKSSRPVTPEMDVTAYVEYTIHKCTRWVAGKPVISPCCSLKCQQDDSPYDDDTGANGTIPARWCSLDCHSPVGHFALCDKFGRAGATYNMSGVTTSEGLAFPPVVASFFVGLYDITVTVGTAKYSPIATVTAKGVPVDATLCGTL